MHLINVLLFPFALVSSTIGTVPTDAELKSTFAAAAAPEAQAFTKCTFNSVTRSDETLLGRWMFSLLSLDADYSPVPVSETDRAKLKKEVAVIFNRIATVSCKDEADRLIRIDDPATFRAALQPFMTIGTLQIFNPAVVVYASRDMADEIDLKSLGAAPREK